jgi:hypothetical protein
VDSVSQQAEIYLNDQLPKQKDPRKAYGILFEKMSANLNTLFYMKQKHTYLICKQTVNTDVSPPMTMPYFPGQALTTFVPHLFDLIMHIDYYLIPNVGMQLAFRCAPSSGTCVRSRNAGLSEYEFPDLTTIFNKILKGV